MRWRNSFRRSGKQGLRPKPVLGRPSRLSKAQKTQLLRHLLAGALAHGYRTDLWTTQRVAEVVRAKFGVRYHRDHVGRLLHGLHWSCQKPERRALQRDEAAIAQWKEREWPRIKKGRRGWAPISSS
jgi:transposase